MAMVFWSWLFWRSPAYSAWAVAGAALGKALKAAIGQKRGLAGWNACMISILGTAVPLALARCMLLCLPGHWSPACRETSVLLVMSLSFALAQQMWPAISLGAGSSENAGDSGDNARTKGSAALTPQLGIIALALPCLGRLAAGDVSPRLALLSCALMYAAFASAARWARRAVETQNMARLSRQLDVIGYKLETERAGHRCTSQSLDQLRDQQKRNEHVLALCRSCRDTAELQSAVFGWCRTMLGTGTSIIFQRDENGIYPAGWDSPYSGILESWRLLEAREAVAELAFMHRQPQFYPPSPYSDTLSIWPAALASSSDLKDAYKSAFLWGENGVLYIGTSQRLSEEQQQFAAFLAQDASACWDRMAAIESKKQQCLALSQRQADLYVWTAKLEKILRSLPQIIGLPSREMLQHLGELTAELVSAPRARVMLGADILPQYSLFWDMLAEHRLPLLLEDISLTRFEPPAPGTRSLLAVPVLEADAAKALIVAESDRAQAFSRCDQDALTLLSLQVAALLRRRTPY